MIEINLLPGKKPRKAPGLGLRLPDFRALLANVKDPWLGAAVGSWVVVGGLSGYVFLSQQGRLRLLEPEHEKVVAEKQRLDVVIRQKQRLERMRDSVASELQVIKAIDGDRYTWAHILDQVTKALPPYTWLTNLSGTTVTDTTDTTGQRSWVTVAVDGRTVDIQAFTTFLRQLAASPWFTDVTPKNSQVVVEADRPVTAFNVTFRFRTADSAYIRVVPLGQSVR